MKGWTDAPAALKLGLAVSLLPVLAWPALLVRAGGNPLVWLYPLATVAYAALALACGRERLTLAWVLTAMSILTSIAIWLI
ncbi:MAG: hypothetical protein K2F97_01070 [Muribaculaceae bacterium]|nr:hypothetical protein [Muribaculaceae bacterium]MDE6485951.1 hypothetical protein [Muribaculaceae bacterium]